eukprot:TRINITY_DN20709_c1_g4_i2.p1 TRINITY_DN20709_c1_g4~~TRINITY_DN20709_c1_g4_i2.p1  ORF type:complete len:567 (-),score=46.26 TRINITY_DN20709_c1_g4_i2:161-1861(-)
MINRDSSAFGVDKVNVNELCDVTSHWIRSMYAEADTDDDGHISSEELIRLLTAHNFVGLSTAHAENMIKHVGLCRGADGAKSRKIDFRQFKAVFKWLRLAELFTPTHGLFQWCQKSNEPMSKLLVHDYNRMVSLRVAPQSEEELQDFFFATQRMVNASNSAAAASDGRGVRWVHVDATAGLDRLMLLRLAVKYHLHPLVIQDVYDNRTETKIDRYEDNYFISLDILALAKEDPRSPGERRGANQRQKQTNDKASGSVKDKAPPRPVRVHRSHVCISLAGPPHWDTILTIHQERADESSWLSSWRGIDHLSDAEPVNDIWVALKSEVEAEPPHRLRSERSDFILYCILRHVVSELRPIAEAYARRLGYMRNLPTQRLPQALLDELSSVQFELVDLSRSIRPMRPTVRKLINDTALSSTARMYLEDVEDALEEMNEDLNQLLAMATSVADDDQKGRDKRMNDTLFVLSIISGIFLPGQFITGLYGMNFVDANGDPNMPELTWEWGYVYFWILQFVALTVAVTSVVFVSLRAGGDKSWKRFFSCCSFSCCGCCCCRRLAETPTKASDES